MKLFYTNHRKIKNLRAYMIVFLIYSHEPHYPKYLNQMM